MSQSDETDAANRRVELLIQHLTDPVTATYVGWVVEDAADGPIASYLAWYVGHTNPGVSYVTLLEDEAAPHPGPARQTLGYTVPVGFGDVKVQVLGGLPGLSEAVDQAAVETAHEMLDGKDLPIVVVNFAVTGRVTVWVPKETPGDRLFERFKAALRRSFQL